MPPPFTAATNLVPSAEEAMEDQAAPPPGKPVVCCTHVLPKLVDVKMKELFTTTASLLPSADEAMARHWRAVELISPHVFPESVEV